MQRKVWLGLALALGLQWGVLDTTEAMARPSVEGKKISYNSHRAKAHKKQNLKKRGKRSRDMADDYSFGDVSDFHSDLARAGRKNRGYRAFE